MTLTAHVATGIAVGSLTDNSSVGFFAGWLTHHVVDGIPHSDPGSWGAVGESVFKNRRSLIWTVCDITIATTLFFLFLSLSGFSTVLFISVLGAAIPDLIDNSPFWSKPLRKLPPLKWFHQFHEVIHYTIKVKKYLWLGIMTQILIIIVSLAAFLLSSAR
ncbi:MAG: hypothetical protein OEV37_01945 [Candidatus Berkelbacteria bacterium]|nr:hypothetical protein [Candidatus Berkelbacteria bacterium]